MQEVHSSAASVTLPLCSKLPIEAALAAHAQLGKALPAATGPVQWSMPSALESSAATATVPLWCSKDGPGGRGGSFLGAP